MTFLPEKGHFFAMIPLSRSKRDRHQCYSRDFAFLSLSDITIAVELLNKTVTQIACLSLKIGNHHHGKEYFSSRRRMPPLSEHPGFMLGWAWADYCGVGSKSFGESQADQGTEHY